jgi:hypothetical protein
LADVSNVKTDVVTWTLGWTRMMIEVTTPKVLPPPPRIAQ